MLTLIFLSVSSAEGPDPCELAQNPRYRKGPDVCFDNNENVSRKPHMLNSSISDSLQLAPVNLCLVSISSENCWLLVLTVPSIFDLFLSVIFISLSCHVFCMQGHSFVCVSFLSAHHLLLYFDDYLSPLCGLLLLRTGPCVQSAEVLH